MTTAKERVMGNHSRLREEPGFSSRDSSCCLEMLGKLPPKRQAGFSLKLSIKSLLQAWLPPWHGVTPPNQTSATPSAKQRAGEKDLVVFSPGCKLNHLPVGLGECQMQGNEEREHRCPLTVVQGSSSTSTLEIPYRDQKDDPDLCRMETPHPAQAANREGQKSEQSPCDPSACGLRSACASLSLPFHPVLNPLS